MRYLCIESWNIKTWHRSVLALLRASLKGWWFKSKKLRPEKHGLLIVRVCLIKI